MIGVGIGSNCRRRHLVFTCNLETLISSINPLSLNCCTFVSGTVVGVGCGSKGLLMANWPMALKGSFQAKDRETEGLHPQTFSSPFPPHLFTHKHREKENICVKPEGADKKKQASLAVPSAAV